MIVSGLNKSKKLFVPLSMKQINSEKKNENNNNSRADLTDFAIYNVAINNAILTYNQGFTYISNGD